MNEADKALDPKEVQDILGIGERTFYYLVKRDPEFTTFKVGRHRKMRQSALERWIELQEKKEMHPA